ALAGPDIPEDVFDVGDGDDALLGQEVSTSPSLAESELLVPESMTSGGGEGSPGGTDAPDGGGGDGGDGDGGGVGTITTGLDKQVTAQLGEEGTSDVADPPGQDVVLPEESSHMEEGSAGDDEMQKGEGVGDGDVATTTDEDDSAYVDSEGAVVLGDDPEGGAGGVTSMAGDGDDAASVSGAIETNDDGPLSAGDVSTTGADALAGGHDATADSGSNDGAVGVSATDGEASAVSTSDDEASGALPTDGDADAPAGETRPHRSWLPWRRHQPTDVDEDPVTNLATAGVGTALAGPDIPEDVFDVGDGDDALLGQEVST
ncbi:unnamed protein product, partial [Ectocarpus fasciculatus]